MRFLRVTLHIGFAVLLLVAILRLHVADGPADVVTPASVGRYVWSALALALAALYVTGTVLEKRYAARKTGFNPHPYAVLWLALPGDQPR